MPPPGVHAGSSHSREIACLPDDTRPRLPRVPGGTRGAGAPPGDGPEWSGDGGGDRRVNEVPVDVRADAGAGRSVHVAVGVDLEGGLEPVAEVGEAVVAGPVEGEDLEPVAVVDGHHDVPGGQVAERVIG